MKTFIIYYVLISWLNHTHVFKLWIYSVPISKQIKMMWKFFYNFLQFFSACNNFFKGRKRKNFAVYVKSLTLIIIKAKIETEKHWSNDVRDDQIRASDLWRLLIRCSYMYDTCSIFNWRISAPLGFIVIIKCMFLFCELLSLTFNLGIKSGFIMTRLIIWYQIHLPSAWQYVS